MDRDISVSCVVAYGLWVLSFALCALAWALNDINVGRLSLIICGASITATVRTYFVTLSRRMRDAQVVTSTVTGSTRVRPMR